MKNAWMQRTLFFLAGIVFVLICGLIQFYWMDLVPYAAFDQQPSWLKQAKAVVGWMPWVVCALVLMLRVVKGKNIRFGAYFLGTATPTVAFVSWVLFGISIESAIYSKKFNSEEWKKNAITVQNSDWPPRLVMVDNLISSNKLDGLSKAEVIELLGVPGNHDYFNNYDLVYWLGPERSFIRIDSEWLAISFDGKNRVREYLLVRD
jgi:hypothetical protein